MSLGENSQEKKQELQQVSEKQQNLQQVENSIDLNRNESIEEEEIKKNTENQLNNSFFDFQQQQNEQIQQNQFQQGFKLSQEKTNNINNQQTQNSTNNIQTSKNSSTKKQIQGKSHQEQNLNSDKKSIQNPTSHNQNKHDFSSNVIFQNLVSPIENNNSNVLTKKPSQEQKQQQQQQQQQQEIAENQEEEDYQDIFERENMHPLKTPQMTPQIKINHAGINQFKQQDSPFLQFCMNQLSPLPSKPFYAQSPFAKIQDVQKGHENKKGNQLKIFASPSPMKGNKEGGSYFGFMAEKILQKKIDFNEIPNSREQDACSKHHHHHNPTNQIEEELSQLEEFSDSQRIKNAKNQSQMSFGSQKALSQDGMNGSFNQFRHFPAHAFPPRTMSFQGISSQKATPVNPTRKPRELFSGLINKNNLSQQTGPNTNYSQDLVENSMSQTASFMGYDKPTTPAMQQTQSQKDRSSFKKQNFKQSQGYENEESIDEDESKNFNSNLKMQRAISFGPGSTAKRQKIVCNCKKSKCLKLYCECFQAGQYCKDCNCTNCANIPENEEEKNQAMQQLKERNPNAFQPKVLQDEITSDAKQHQKGCNCKKSHCTKKYCECFQAGVPCTDLCKCEQCHNSGGGPCNHDDSTPYNSQMLPGMHINPQQYYPPHPYPYPSYPPDSALEQGRYPMPPPYYPYPNCTDKCCQHLLPGNPQQTQDDSALTSRRSQFPSNMHQFQTSSAKKKIKEMPYYYYDEYYHNYYPEYYHSQGFKEKFHMTQQMRYFPNTPYPPSYYNQFQGYMYGYPPHPIYMHPRRPSISSNEEENEAEQPENQQESQEQEQEQEQSQNQDLTDQFNEQYQQHQHQQQQKQQLQQDNNLNPYQQFHQGNQVRQLSFLSGYKDHNKIAKQMKFDQEGSFIKSNQLKEQQTSLSAQKKIQQLLTPQKNNKNQSFKSQNQSIQKTPQQKQQFFSGKKPNQKQQKQKSQQSLQTDIEDDIEQEDSNQQSEQKMSSNSKQGQNSGSKIHHENNQINQEEDISNDENEQINILENNIKIQQQQQQKQINQISAQKQQNPNFKTNNSSTTKKLNQVQQKLNFLNKKQQQQQQQVQQIQFQDQQIPYDLQQQLQNQHPQQNIQQNIQQNSLKKTPVADKRKSIINKHEDTLEKKQKLVSLSKSKVTTPNPNKDMTSNKKLKTPNNQEIFQTPVTGRNLQQRFYSDEIASENIDDLPELDENQEDSENIIHDINQNQNQNNKITKQAQKKTAKQQDQQLLQQQQQKKKQQQEEQEQQQNQQQDFEQEQQQQQEQNGKNKKKQKQQRKLNSNKLNCKQQMEEQEQEQEQELEQEQICQEKSQQKQIEELPAHKQKLQDKKQPVKDNSTIKKRPPSKRIIQKKAKLQQI